MPTSYKDSQTSGTSSTSTYTTLYTTTGATSAIISNILIANESGSAILVRLGLSASASTPQTGSFLLYDVLVAANDTLSFGPYSLGNNKFIRVSSSSSACSFSAAVAEIS